MPFRHCQGHADPFGLLIAAVVLAVSLTAFIQAQAASPGGGLASTVSSILGNSERGG